MAEAAAGAGLIRSLNRRAKRTISLARNPAARHEYLDVLRDVRRWERESGPVLRSIQAPPNGPRVLFVSLSDHPHQLKLETMLAKALALYGRTPIVLTPKHATWAERYFRAAGIDRFVHPESFGDNHGADEAVAAAVSFLAGEVTVQRLKALEYRSVRVGIQTLSTLSRSFEKGRIRLSDPAVRRALERILPQAMQSVHAGEALLDSVDPEIMVFLEKGYAGFGELYDVALNRNVNVIQYVASGIHWRDALLFKRYTQATRRVHPASLAQPTWERVRALPWTRREERELEQEFAIRYGPAEKHPDAGLQAGKAIRTADEVRSELGLRADRKVAVLFSHVLWDANLFYGDDLFEDQETWLVETVRAAVANPELDWLIKLHPANAYKTASGRALNDENAIREAVGELPSHVKLLGPDTPINTYSLFQLADYGITIRGTVGFELPCFGVPVLTAGTGRYSNLGFTVDSHTAEEYLNRLGHLHELPPLTSPETELAKRHTYALFRLRPTRFTSFENHYGDRFPLSHPLGQNLELKISSPKELDRALDLRAFGAWAIDRSQLDYLDTEATGSPT
jgi:hypothetical protein